MSGVGIGSSPDAGQSPLKFADAGEIFVELAAIVAAELIFEAAGVVANEIKHALSARALRRL